MWLLRVSLGKLKDIMTDTPRSSTAGEERRKILYIPGVPEFIREKDEDRTVRVVLPEGLLEL